MATGYIQRSAELEELDMEAGADHNWFPLQKWVGMALSIQWVRRKPGRTCFHNRTATSRSWASTWVHIMPILNGPSWPRVMVLCRKRLRQSRARGGTTNTFSPVADDFRKREILLVP